MKQKPDVNTPNGVDDVELISRQKSKQTASNRLSNKDNKLIHETLLRLYAVTDTDMFATEIMTALPELVSVDVASYTELNPKHQRAVGAMDSPEAEATFLKYKPLFEKFMHQHPLIRHFQQKTNEEPKKISDFMSLKQWKSTDIYNEFYVHFGLTRQMVVVLPTEHPRIVGVALNREHKDFSERDRLVLKLVRPHLALAYANAEQYTDLSFQVSLRDKVMDSLGSGLIELDERHCIERISDLARDCLEMFFLHQNRARTGLPKDVNDWVAKLVFDHENNSASIADFAPLIVEQNRGRLILRLIPSSSNHNLVISTERYTYSFSAIPLRDIGLTNREADILYWVAQGKSNTEIGIVLGIHPGTVKKHLESIFNKMQVNTRTQAAIKAIHILHTNH